MSYDVFIGVGHGGSDPGASYGGHVEKNIALNIALSCKRHLERHSLAVAISRTRDENDTIQEEIREANASGAKVAVDIHINAGGGDGFEIFRSITGGLGVTLAKNIESEVIKIGQNSRGVKTKTGSNGKDYYAFIRETTMHAVIAECAFIDTADINIVDTLDEQNKFGEAIAKGILTTLGISYKGESTPQPSPGAKELYRVRKTWADAATQKGAYSNLEGAKKCADQNPGYSVFNSSGVKIYPGESSYKVQITGDVVNVRKGPGTNYGVATTVKQNEVYTIVGEQNGFGKLKSGAGWISLQFTKRI